MCIRDSSYVVAKVISTGLTLVFVKSDTNVLVIPALEIIGTLSAVIFSSVFVKRLQISISFSKPIVWWREIKASLVFFSSNIATTAFGALNTVLIGIFLSKADVAYWSIAFQLVTAVQTMYSPITNSLYPHMLQEKSRKIIKRIMRLIMPIITVGCVFCLIFADWIMGIVAGKQYVDAAPLFQMLVPLMFVSFPAILYGWPVLGAINRNKETAFSTIIAAMVQVLGIVVLGIANNFGVYQLAIVRIVSETTLFGIRYVYYRKNIGCFVD